jgi:SnoaL-like protein
MMSYFAPDAVWEVVALGTRLDGAGAIRGVLEDWRASYEQFEIELEEIRDLGNGVGLTVMAQAGRLAGGTGRVRYRFAQVTTWAEGVAIRVSGSPDIDDARAAAERLAEERA